MCSVIRSLNANRKRSSFIFKTKPKPIAVTSNSSSALDQEIAQQRKREEREARIRQARRYGRDNLVLGGGQTVGQPVNLGSSDLVGL